MEPGARCVVCRKEPQPEDAVLTCVNCGNVAHVPCGQWFCNETCFAAVVESERRSIEQLACHATGAVASSDEEEGDGEDAGDGEESETKQKRLQALRDKHAAHSASYQLMREKHNRLQRLAAQSTEAVDLFATEGSKLKDEIEKLQQEITSEKTAKTLKRRAAFQSSKAAAKKAENRLRSLGLDLSVVTWLCNVLPTDDAAARPFGAGLAQEESSHPLASFGFTHSDRGACYSNLLKKFKNTILSASERLELNTWDLIAFEAASGTPTAQLFADLHELLAHFVSDYTRTESKTTINTRLLKILDCATSAREPTPSPQHCPP